MAHLKTFSRLHHGRFSEYDKGLTAGQAYIINDNGTERQIEIDDIYNPDLNFHFSDQTVPRSINGEIILGGRRISFNPKTLNTSPEFLQNIPVDLSGCSVSPKVFDSKLYDTQSWRFYDTNVSNQLSEYNHVNRSGVFNFDNYNSFLRWTTILVSPRHVLMCGHCYNQLCSPTDVDNQLSKIFYANTQFLGKNNVYYRGFQSQQQAIDLGVSGNLRFLRCGSSTMGSSSCPTCEDIPRSQSFILLELPNATWLDTSQVKVYNKIAVNSFVPTGYPIYLLRGGGHVVVPKLYPYNSYTDTINDSTNSAWTGDSHSPVLLNYLNETILGPRVEAEEIFFDEDIIDYMNEFMAPTGYQLEKIYISYADLPSNFLGETETYFSTINDSILSNSPYGSRFSKNERENFKSINIGFIPGNQLQASELNELQDLFHKQITLSNKIMSEMIIDNIDSDTVLFKNVSQTNDPILLIKRNTYDSLFEQDGIPTAIGSGVFPLKLDSSLLFYEKFNNLEFKFRGEPPLVFSFYLNYTSNKQKTDLSDELTYFLSDSAHRIYFQKEAIGGFNSELFACKFVFNDEYSYDGHLFEQP